MPTPLLAEPDCIPCALRQVLSSARRVSDDPWFHTSVLKRVMSAMSKADMRHTPAELSFEALKAASRVLGVRDPYLEDKRRENARLMELLPELRQKVAESRTPVALAAKLAVAGNIIDLGIVSTVDIKAEIGRALEVPLAVDDTGPLREAVRAAKTVVYILDNAGEIVLDRLLIEQMKRKEITCIVRSTPVLNDVTIDDAIAVGLDKLATIIDPGAPMLGLVLNLASDEVQEKIRTADLVISKGQANFETLYDIQREVYFLLRAKCPIVAKALGVEFGAAVVSRREPAEETETRVENVGSSV
jgi:uncharacterized protein with ATP-grasp and redox domains